MPQATKAAVHPGTLDTYISACVALAQERLHHFPSLTAIAAREKEINRYPRLELLEEPRRILVLAEDDGDSARRARAQAALARGDILLEHAAAG